MIIVEITVPAMGKKYDFRMDETALLGDVRDEIAGMICRKEQRVWEGGKEALLLFTTDGRMLPMDRCAAEAGIRTGSSLLLL